MEKGSFQFEELRQYVGSEHCSRANLPENAANLIATICDRYVSGTGHDRATIQSQVTFELSFLFFLFSQKMAENAVQDMSEESLTQSIVALIVEDCAFDSRDSIIALSKVFRSAQLIGISAVAFFENMVKLSNPPMSSILESFGTRAPENREISAFGFKEGRDENGRFAYIPLTPPSSLKDH